MKDAYIPLCIDDGYTSQKEGTQGAKQTMATRESPEKWRPTNATLELRCRWAFVNSTPKVIRFGVLLSRAQQEESWCGLFTT